MEIKKDYDYIYNEATNEELVDLIQRTNESIYWDALHTKTKKLFHYVFHKHVNSFYKENYKDEVYSVFKIGWVKAINTYNASKATSGFVPYASEIMRQHYEMFRRRIKEDRIGKSVRYDLFSGVSIDSEKNDDKMQNGCITNIMKYECDDFHDIEIKDFIKEKLVLLEKEDPIQYLFIKKHYLEGISQKKLGELYNMNQSAISRKIRKGLNFLRNYIKKEDVY